MTRYALADGSVATARIYEGVVLWRKEKRRVWVIAGDSDFTLLGMGLLQFAKTLLWPERNMLSVT